MVPTADNTGSVQGNTPPSTFRRMLPMVLLFVLFAAPLVAAYLWRPAPDAATSNFGQLVTPPRAPLNIQLQTLKDEPLAFSGLKGKWTLLYVGNEDCDKVCIDNLYKIDRVRLTQAKKMKRVQNVYIAPEQVDPQIVRQRISAYTGLIGLRISTASRAEMAKYFERGGHGPLHQRIYVIDPIGNLMMSYPADADPSGMRRDLARLLKASQIG